MRALRVLPLYLGVGSTGIVALVSIPIMIKSSSLDEWSSIGVGQSVGGVIAAIISYGWAITGPIDIANGTRQQRRREYAESVRTRLAITPIALLLGVGITATVTGLDGLISGTIGLLSTALPGLSALYFFLGTGELWKSFFFDAVPRAFGTLVGLAVIVISGLKVDAIAVPLGTSVGALAALGLSTIAVNGGFRDPEPLPRERILVLLRTKRHGLLTSISTGAFQVLPTIVVGWFAPAALSEYVFYDKIYKQVMTFLSPALNVFQGWVPRASGDSRVRRMRFAMLSGLGCGLLCLIGSVVLGKPIVAVLSSGEVDARLVPLLAVGFLIAFSAVDLIVSRVGLVVKGRMGALAASSVVSFAIGIVLVAILAPRFGTDGALIATALGVGVRLCYSYVAYRRVPATVG